ncbi:MAG: hypothetical protein LQ349_001477 [Xanthoria aureola]|nr:MAG: hypothetical protein LQ349_001477 [Xanthoria aureola]
MATTLANSPRNVEGTNGAMRNNDDPFTSTPTMQPPRQHRYSSFTTGLFAENHPSSSPSHAKRALEAHIAETERRLQEASRLGTTLVEQRQKLSARLREVELQQTQQELGPELRQRLVDIEKEYNEVGRESARAFLGPKADPVPTADSESSFALDGTRPASPAKFSSRATDSPSKVSVPRKSRNQPANQVHDIQLAADISTSLLAQVRQLQAMLSEKDDGLKNANLEVSRLEQEADGFAQRLRSMDESEQRYKDENWSLETQLYDLTAEHKEAASREHRIQQALTLATSEKNATLRELDDLKQAHGKAIEDHTLMRKNQDSELGSLRRDLNSAESERSSLQRKVEDLTSQNQELAKAVSSRFRSDTPEEAGEPTPDAEAYPVDPSDTDHSPPASPTKGGQRHSVLESETLKSSLHHAHRMIQNLKGNVHREKTEKLELKRMLQEARDELDVRRSEGPSHKRLKSKSQQDLKKAGRPNMLGAGRNGRTDITVDDPGWEDHSMDDSPQLVRSSRVDPTDPALMTDMSDAYQTANETEDGFETAQERDYPTENEAFPTGAEDMAGDSSEDMTETEGGLARGHTIRNKRPMTLMSTKAEGLSSYTSTASASADDNDTSFRTPIHAQSQKYRLKLNRGNRKTRLASEGFDSNPSTAKGSPASFMDTSGQGNQNLFAELDDLNGMDSSEDATPSRKLASQLSSASIRRSGSSKRRRSVSSQTSSQSIRPSTVPHSGNEPPVPRIPVVDSGTMTEPWNGTSTSSEPNGRPSTSYRTPSKATADAPAFSPQSESSKPPTAATSAVDSPSTARSTPPKTAWDQPLSMFSSIIPTFGQSANTTPFSAKSTTTQDEAVDETNQSIRSSIVSLPSIDDTAFGMSPAKGYASQPLRELSLSPIQGIGTAPIEPQPETLTDAAGLKGAGLPTQGMQEYTRTAARDSPTVRRLPAGQITSSSAPGVRDGTSVPPEPSSGRLNQGATGRILGSIFGPSSTQPAGPVHIAEDETSQPFDPPANNADVSSERVLRELPSNSIPREYPDHHDFPAKHKAAPSLDTADHSAQTTLSADQIEHLIRQKEAAVVPKPLAIPPLKPLSAIGASPPATSQKFPESLDQSKSRSFEQTSREAPPYAKGIKKPISSSSMRMSNSSGSHPPLPPDHQQAIAAAAQRTSSTEPPAVMGPPLAPASAYKSNTVRPRTPSRPRTANEQPAVATPASRNSTTPRARNSTMRSRMSRRSSVSSFESELDERFNIRLDGMPMPDGVDSGTDPRMIQAITQTMIGEFLWKYTRKAGRGEMSNNRHRRFFWVHPYTKTLYWSDRDPSTAGRAEMKAKSVAIEAVRVVTDDNPTPLGLHRKSIIVVTPGRSVKLTAQTSQRHETWFNALSYLLIRTGPEGTDNNGITAEDLAEFNPSFGKRGSSRTHGSRISLASFRSRGKTPEPPVGGRSPSRHSTRQPTGHPQPSDQELREALQPQPAAASTRSRRGSNSLSHRISSYWKPNRGTSVSSRTSQQSAAGAPMTASGPRPDGNMAAGVYRPTSSAAGSRQGSESDLSLRAPRGSGASGYNLENVRACCDGKHDVGNLAHRDDWPGGGGGGGRPKYAKAGQGPSSQSVRSSRSNILAGGGEIA